MDLEKQMEIQRKRAGSALQTLLGYAGELATEDLESNSETLEQMNYPGASPQASFATTAHPCLDASDTCLSPRSARSRKRGI